MSSRRGSPAEKGEEENVSPERGDHGDENEPRRDANGSIFAKLFAKETREDAAVDADEQVEARENGELNGHTAGSNDEYEDEVEANGFADGQNAEDDEDDDEYDPNDASDAESSGESDDSDGDLDDEETSMRSLLQPLATYAKQLLFYSDEDDNGEFDAQDAELWASQDEKRAWIAQYEAKNREYEARYGCRIDSSAMPDVKRKLRRERKRESKYSIVLVALAVAYFIRLMVGAPTSTITITPTETPAELTTVPAPETGSSMPGSTQVQVKDASSPLWWTVWTENLVVRVVTWPSQYFTSKTESIIVKQPAKIEPTQKVESTAAQTSPSTLPAPVENQPKPAIEKEEELVHVHVENVIQREAAVAIASNDELKHPREMEARETPETTPTDSARTTTVDVVIETEVIEVEVTVQSVPTGHETVAVPALPLEDEATAAVNELAHEGEPARTVDGDVLVGTHQLEDRDAAKHATTTHLLSDCFDLFHKLIKTKNDPDLKLAAIEACDAAVQSSAASQDTSMEWIQAHVLRGDLKSLLYKFEEARADYETAITSAHSSDLPLDSRDTIELKLAANRWIELYQTKKFKELRSECERVVDTSSTQPSIPRDLLQGVAGDWLRVFKREKPLMDVLIKTRAWTINPLKLH